jgi:hypothetical protein
MRKLFALVLCVACGVSINAQADDITVSTVINVSGQWNVHGKNLSGKVFLPGTLADAGLGV